MAGAAGRLWRAGRRRALGGLGPRWMGRGAAGASGEVLGKSVPKRWVRVSVGWEVSEPRPGAGRAGWELPAGVPRHRAAAGGRFPRSPSAARAGRSPAYQWHFQLLWGFFYCSNKVHSSNRAGGREATGAGGRALRWRCCCPPPARPRLPPGRRPGHKLNVVFYADPRCRPRVVSVCEWGSRTLVCLWCLGGVRSFLGTRQERDVGDSSGGWQELPRPPRSCPEGPAEPLLSQPRPPRSAGPAEGSWWETSGLQAGRTVTRKPSRPGAACGWGRKRLREAAAEIVLRLSFLLTPEIQLE